MPTSVLQPATVFNFMVTLWDEEGPFETGSEAGGLLGAAVGFATQWLMGAFCEVQGLTSEIELEPYHEGGRNANPHRFVKVAKYNELVLKRGVSLNGDLWEWQNQVLRGSEAIIRKGGMIILFDRNGPANTGFGIPGADRLPIGAWTFTGGLPSRMRGPDLNAKSNEIAIESLEISHEGLTRVSLGSIPGLADVASVFGAGVSGIVSGGVAAATVVPST